MVLYYLIGINFRGDRQDSMSRVYIFADSASKCCKNPQNCQKMTEFSEITLFAGTNFRELCQKPRNPRKLTPIRYSDSNNKQHVSPTLRKCQDVTRCTTYKKLKPGLRLNIVITITEHACGHVLKKLSEYPFQIFLVKYEYLRSIQLLTKAYGESLRNVLTILTQKLYGDQALKRYPIRLQQLHQLLVICVQVDNEIGS